jgi:hypothetical protein
MSDFSFKHFFLILHFQTTVKDRTETENKKFPVQCSCTGTVKKAKAINASALFHIIRGNTLLLQRMKALPSYDMPSGQTMRSQSFRFINIV